MAISLRVVQNINLCNTISMETPLVIEEHFIHKTLTFKQVHELNADQKRFFTIILSTEPTPTVMTFRCFNCGSIVFQYYNRPRAAFEGAINISECEKPTDHLCKKCNIMYRVT
jgi:hypothetical protein